MGSAQPGGVLVAAAAAARAAAERTAPLGTAVSRSFLEAVATEEARRVVDSGMLGSGGTKAAEVVEVGFGCWWWWSKKAAEAVPVWARVSVIVRCGAIGMRDGGGRGGAWEKRYCGVGLTLAL